MRDWELAETNTHQDHVIAHVIGATVLGHFVFDETAFLLLDIGFIWHMYLDGEMGLRPHPVAIAELETDELTKRQLQADVDAALQQRRVDGPGLFHLLSNSSPMQSVEFFVRENSRRLLIACEEGSIVVETSLEAGEVTIMETENDDSSRPEENQNQLASAAREEREFVRQTLTAELERDPTEEELNEWLREHTEGY
ncbi:MAG TPA: hypothetical protein VLA93_21980 [Pyrinomonadaceae bacterium]|nr:hypothetical protein [Pyrinomonadaceae bacterium]